MTGCHSVIERPESVSRVAPPTRIMTTIKAASAPSQMRSARSPRSGWRGLPVRGGEGCVEAMAV